MTGDARGRATRNYRARLARRGFRRCEVMARDQDRGLIRALARRMAEGGETAEETRAALRALVADGAPGKGGVLAALRRSPLAGAGLDLSRPRTPGRSVDL